MKNARNAWLGAIPALLFTLSASAPARALGWMTRAQVVDNAKKAVGYSYWWGHGRWRTDFTQLGSCSGSCPNCSHVGSYGADCSGFLAKVWQVPSSSLLTTDLHPYSTYQFRCETWHEWSSISKGSALKSDAFAYREGGCPGTSGHVFLYESGNPWGSAWTYECRSCSYGCVHNLRTVYSSYVARRRLQISG